MRSGFLHCDYLCSSAQAVLGGTVIMGDLTIQGNIRGLSSLSEPLTIAMENGATRALLPISNKSQFSNLPEEVVEKVDWYFSATRKSCGESIGIIGSILERKDVTMKALGERDSAFAAELLAEHLLQVYKNAQISQSVEDFCLAGFSRESLAKNPDQLFRMIVLAADMAVHLPRQLVVMNVFGR